MQILFLWDSQGNADKALAEQILVDGSTDTEVRRGALDAAAGTWEQRKMIDERLERIAPQWPPRRQPGVDRNLIRLAVWEMTSTDTPPKVAIDEAIEMAKIFSTEQSASFVNGVLDAVLKENVALIQPSPSYDAVLVSHSQITVWRLMAHHAATAEALRWFSQTGLIAIGWGTVGNIATGRYATEGDITKALSEVYPDLKNVGSGGPCLFAFCHDLAIGDLVIVSGDGHRALVMEVEGEYDYKSDPEPLPIGDYQHRRKARVIAIDPDVLWEKSGAGPKTGYSVRWTLIECANSVSLATKNQLLASSKLRTAAT